MDRSGDGTRDPALKALEQELDVVRGAIAMVASGGAPRVQLGSLRFASQLIEPARRMAAGTDVRVTPIWTTDEACTGMYIERAAGG